MVSEEKKFTTSIDRCQLKWLNEMAKELLLLLQLLGLLRTPALALALAQSIMASTLRLINKV